jgi:hypothetical protein
MCADAFEDFVHVSKQIDVEPLARGNEAGPDCRIQPRCLSFLASLEMAFRLKFPAKRGMHNPGLIPEKMKRPCRACTS